MQVNVFSQDTFVASFVGNMHFIVLSVIQWYFSSATKTGKLTH